VLTPDLFRSSPLRGNLEYDVEVLPVYTIFTPNGAVYGGSVKPFIVRWNFTAPRRVVPYFHLAGGALFTTSNVPPGDTSQINFTPQLGGGIHWFRGDKQSVDFGVDLVHHSNASLGNTIPATTRASSLAWAIAGTSIVSSERRNIEAFKRRRNGVTPF
jgi:hypothetical protein